MLTRLRGWVGLGVALAAVAVLSVISAAEPPSREPLAADNAAPSGGLALYMWLDRIGYQVGKTGSVQENTAAGGTVLILDPPRELTHDEITRVRATVRDGKNVVLATDGAAWSTFSALGLRLVPSPSDAVTISQPLLLAPPAARLRGFTSIVGADVGEPGSVAETGYGDVLVERDLGRGHLWLLTAPELLDNAHLGEAENRELALNLVGPKGSAVSFVQIGPPPAPSGASGDWLTGTVWGVALLCALGILLIFRWLGGWRLGPPVVPFRESRRPAVEYVYSLADLLQRGRKRTDVLRTYQRWLRRRVAARAGAEGSLPASQLATRVGELLETRDDLTEAELLQRVNRILECEEELRHAHV